MVAVFDGVDVSVGELGAFVVEAVFVGEDFLEGWSHDFVGDGLGVYGVEDGGVLDLEGAVGVGVEIVAARVGEQGFGDGVACAAGVPVGGARHGMGFGVDEAVGVAVEHWVDAEREDMLVVGCEDTMNVF